VRCAFPGSRLSIPPSVGNRRRIRKGVCATIAFVPPLTPEELFPAEHRALREVFATSRQLAGHWSSLADRVGEPASTPLREGVATAKALGAALETLAAERDLRLRPAALGAGRWLAGVRNGSADVLLERNQALRLAVLDAEHVALALAYVGALAERRGDAALAAFHREWEQRLRAAADAARDAAIATADDPDAAIEPAVPGPVGRAGHKLAEAIGTVGETVDNSPLGRAVTRGGGSR
jgi:hypothetical protein